MPSPLTAAAADHPYRRAVLEDLHARLAPEITAPARVLHLAVKHPEDAAHRDREEDLRQVSALLGAPAPPGATRHTAEHVGYRVTWESHSEYVGYTALATGTGPAPFTADPGDAFPPDWERSGPARRIAAVAVEVLPMPASPALAVADAARWLDPDSMLVTPVLGGSGVLAGDFRADPHGFTRFALFVRPGTDPGSVGRTVQRVLDLETYRFLATLGYLASRDLATTLDAIGPRLLELIDALDETDRPADDVLHELLLHTAELERLVLTCAFRFGATRAYAAIVEDRLDGLGGGRLLGHQTLRDFLSRRYTPAIRTALAEEVRLTRMLERAGRASSLLRTRVVVARTAHNQALLRSMDARADIQLRLEHTVEGVSVVAISYYLIGLLAYVLAPLAAARGLDKAALMAASVPAALLVTSSGLWWVRSRIHRSA